MKPHVLFVCTGNICRSPLAEVLAGQMFGGLGLEFRSAGLAAPDGHPAAQGSCLYAGSLGLALQDHRSRPLTAGLLAGASWVIGMTSAHAAEVDRTWGRDFPGRIGVLGAPGRVFRTAPGTAADPGAQDRSPQDGPAPDQGLVCEEVADPYGQALERYAETGRQIGRLLAGWAQAFRAAALPQEDCG